MTRTEFEAKVLYLLDSLGKWRKEQPFMPIEITYYPDFRVDRIRFAIQVGLKDKDGMSFGEMVNEAIPTTD